MPLEARIETPDIARQGESFAGANTMIKNMVAAAALLTSLVSGQFAVSPTAHAGGLDLALSNETAHLSVLLNPYELYQGGSELALGAFVNELGDNLVHATLLARGVQTLSNSQYKLGAGMKAIGGNLEVDETVGALALGFQAVMLLSSSQYNPVDFTIEGFYAPSITSFSDSDEYTEFSARLQIEVIPQARAYLGYRRITFDTNDFGEQQLDRSVHLGLNITF